MHQIYHGATELLHEQQLGQQPVLRHTPFGVHGSFHGWPSSRPGFFLDTSEQVFARIVGCVM